MQTVKLTCRVDELRNCLSDGSALVILKPDIATSYAHRITLPPSVFGGFPSPGEEFEVTITKIQEESNE